MIKTKNNLNLGCGIAASLLLSLLLWSNSGPPAAAPAEFSVYSVKLPISWNNWPELISTGTINKEKLSLLYASRGGVPSEIEALLAGEDLPGSEIIMTSDNAGAYLNLLWAFGLANQNSILTTGPMADPRYGGDPSRFAATGGWPLATGDVMDHYSRHQFLSLTPEQQALVERVSQNIYRPCCGNSTHFPDCNHGMAMLGLLELLAASNVSESEMYAVALQVNTLWFPNAYEVISEYFAGRGIAWNEVNPQTVLGSAYSGAAGFRQILSEVNPPASNQGSGCSA